MPNFLASAKNLGLSPNYGSNANLHWLSVVSQHQGLNYLYIGQFE